MKSPAPCWLLVMAAIFWEAVALAPARTAVDTKSVSDSIKHDETANSDEDDEGDEDDDEEGQEDVAKNSSVPLALTQSSSKPLSPTSPEAMHALPANFDAISFLAETETAEEAASAAESEAMVAEAAAARSAARLRRAQLRRAAGGSEEDRQIAETSLHAAQTAWQQRAPRARQLTVGAREARRAARQRAEEVSPNLGASSLLRTFGPENCVSTWRDASSGTCFLKTDCEGVQTFNLFDVGFLCENADKEPVEHRFGTNSYARVEVQDTAVACERCMPTQEKQQTAQSLSQEMSAMKQSLAKVSETFVSLKDKASELLR
mmetsp:Transcript_10693/g.25911  ORF Transcript_10693/g.25911 Transcript_10693/m.25911 type:complete len:319 (-) Transcript_10693:31-987(-)